MAEAPGREPHDPGPLVWQAPHVNEATAEVDSERRSLAIDALFGSYAEGSISSNQRSLKTVGRIREHVDPGSPLGDAASLG